MLELWLVCPLADGVVSLDLAVDKGSQCNGNQEAETVATAHHDERVVAFGLNSDYLCIFVFGDFAVVGISFCSANLRKLVVLAQITNRLFRH